MSRPRLVENPRRFHAVRFYQDSTSFCRLISQFLIEGLEQGEPAILIATLPHAAAVHRELSTSGYDTDRLQKSGQLLSYDAQETLDQFMVDGMPDETRFHRVVRPVLEHATGGDKTRVIRAYGEMVCLLWKSGLPAAAGRLESLWNKLAESYSIAILCGYAVASVDDGSAVKQICSLHTHVINERGHAAPVG